MNGKRYKYLFIIADIFIIFIGFILSVYLIKNDANLTLSELLSNSLSFIWFGIVLALINIFVFEVNHLYKINIILSRAAHLSSIIKSLYYGIINVILIAILFKSSTIIDSQGLIFFFPLLVLPLFYLIRIGLLRLVYLQISKTKVMRNLVIVGGGKAGKLLAAKVIFENPIGLNIVGFINSGLEQEASIFGQKYLGFINDINSIVREKKVNEIIIAIDGIHYEKLLEILDVCKSTKIEVKLSSELFDIIPEKISTEKYADIPVVGISKIANNALSLGFKRLFDLVICSFAILLLLPAFIMLGLAIKLTSKGSVIYHQTRIGKNGKPFKFYKFRSMTTVDEDDKERQAKMIEFIKNSDKNSGDLKVVSESRITPIGKVLRKTSLDELPQLFNVLMGDMSLVGPRPCLQYEYDNYNDWQRRRLSVIPGCTGVWQVMGRSSVSFNDSVIMDLYYINNMSPWLDLELIIKTIPTMLLARGGK
ncbi:MAG: sugar transferase [Melioribacteraceae bacterium]|nr:sugar transferase [Melioribacteraceae bacterium]